MMNYVIGIDLGGTNIRAAAVTPGGEIFHRIKISSEVEKGKERVVRNLLDMIEEIDRRAKGEGRRLISVGLGIPGTIFYDRGVIAQSPNFPDWIDFDLKSRLAKDISLPFFIDNDANAAAIGEGWLGAGKDEKSFCCLTLGTGIGGGLVFNGDIWHGEDGMGGEIGHLIVDPDGPACGCGGRGCLETYASATGIIRMAKESYYSSDAVGLRERSNNNIDTVSSEMIYNLAKEGDYYTRDILRAMSRHLGIGLADLVNLLNIGLIIIGGGVAAAWDLFIADTIKEMRERSYKVPGERVRIVRASCGDDAGILGAACIALKHSNLIRGLAPSKEREGIL
ncbi:MAG: ROK family protein [Nitrospinota bacterium]